MLKLNLALAKNSHEKFFYLFDSVFRYFNKFFDRRFGNCFTFNSGLNATIAKANVAGPTNGKLFFM